MCRSSRELGGPRRCSSHGRTQLENSSAAAAVLDRQAVELERHLALARCGLRAADGASTTDFPVIGARADTPEAWGFYRSSSGGGRVDLWADLDDGTAEEFLDGLSAAERSAITDYTGGWSGEIVAAMAGDPSAAPQAVGMAATLAAVLGRYRRSRPMPAVVARGVPVPEPWTDTREFLDTAFVVGARVDLVAVASASHNFGVVAEFAEFASSYVMVMQAPALPIRPLSAFPWEDESLVAPTSLRVVHVDHCGTATAGIPAVYLLDEAMLASYVGDEECRRSLEVER